ncbi:GntR family transcriptional regulator [Streptomyces sp. 150FB]|uniref:GntR family transcriptional regulator n=1 Tax=Streptomyces sp. 150FB TaxID=1576605 RepID=UPI0005893D10|nr:GntR family transcriptional regulator [Streptomyces sp. 150FB]KIF73350.1 GntR family transcriptional regulator [Streptomyces sp. 150FB]
MGTTQLETVPEPKYWHLRTVLGEALDSDFAVGEVLPNERELAARFGVARATLRQALEQLELEGRLQRRRGVGTTVAPPRVGVDVSTTQHEWPGTVQDAWQAVDCTTGPAPLAVARMLEAGAGDDVHVVRRIRVTHGQSVAAELLYVPTSSVPGLSAIDAPSGPARARGVLRELQHLGLDGQDRAVELGSAGADDAKELDRLPGAPVLVVTTRYVVGGATAAVSMATYRADTCRLTFGDSGDLEISDNPPERRAS